MLTAAAHAAPLALQRVLVERAAAHQRLIRVHGLVMRAVALVGIVTRQRAQPAAQRAPQVKQRRTGPGHVCASRPPPARGRAWYGASLPARSGSPRTRRSPTRPASRITSHSIAANTTIRAASRR